MSVCVSVTSCYVMSLHILKGHMLWYICTIRNETTRNIHNSKSFLSMQTFCFKIYNKNMFKKEIFQMRYIFYFKILLRQWVREQSHILPGTLRRRESIESLMLKYQLDPTGLFFLTLAILTFVLSSKSNTIHSNSKNKNIMKRPFQIQSVDIPTVDRKVRPKLSWPLSSWPLFRWAPISPGPHPCPHWSTAWPWWALARHP